VGGRGTLFLAALLLVAATVAYFDVASDPDSSWETFLGAERPTPAGQGSQALVSFVPAEIDSLRLRRDGVDVAFERDANGWKGATDPRIVDDFLAGLAGLSRIDTLDVPSEQLADHGLAPPRAVIDLVPRGGSPIEIRIGERNPPATSVYAQVGTERAVVLTGALILWELEKALRAAQRDAPAIVGG
jgi:hypothetical protein